MRKTLSNHQEVCHYWAHQRQSEGRSNNLSFQGNILLSYHHWWIGRILDVNGQPIALLRSDSYSVSTSKHQNYARRAVSHLTSFCVPFAGYNREEHEGNIQYFIHERDSLRQQAKRARSNKEWLLERQQDTSDQCAQYLDVFKDEFDSEFIKKVQAILNDEEGQTLVILREELNRTKAEREAKERARQIEQEQEDLVKWRNHDSQRRSFTTTALRLSPDKQAIQTTHGASVPLEAAKALWSAYKAGKTIEGRHIGPFTINHVNGETITIGCHVVPTSEIETVLN